MIGYFLKMRIKSIFYIIFISIMFLSFLYQFKFYKNIHFSLYSNYQKLPIIVWWTPFYDNNFTKDINCNINKCIITGNRIFVSEPEAVVYLFYGSNFKPYDLPIPRKKTDLWAIIHEESPKNLALFLHENSHKLFNFTSTFSRHSNFPITLQYLPNKDLLTSKTFFIPVHEKNKLLNKLAPILYIQSDCMTPLERDSYVVELMKYISIDSYGKCLNNKILPKQLLDNHLNNLYSDEFLHFTAQYKYVIAFENAVCEDYITEKLWRPIIAGTIPIYLGSPTVKDWLPNNNSAIIASDFDSPQDLAQHLSKLNSDDELYNNYLEHKFGKIENTRLTNYLKDRQWNIDDNEGPHFFESYECFICDNIYNLPLTSSGNIYNCPDPVSPLTKRKNDSNWWHSHWNEGKCQAKALKQLLNNATITNITKATFDSEAHDLLLQNNCN